MAQEGWSDMWAGEDWDQSPPPITDYATPAQERAWHLHRGITTNFQDGASPERIIRSSAIAWMWGFGCFPLLEDALAMSPATQHFHRNGNGVCEGTYLKQTQFICHTLVMMLQVSLCPTENMQTGRSCSPSPDYPWRRQLQDQAGRYEAVGRGGEGGDRLCAGD